MTLSDEERFSFLLLEPFNGRILLAALLVLMMVPRCIEMLKTNRNSSLDYPSIVSIGGQTSVTGSALNSKMFKAVI